MEKGNPFVRATDPEGAHVAAELVQQESGDAEICRSGGSLHRCMAALFKLAGSRPAGAPKIAAIDLAHTSYGVGKPGSQAKHDTARRRLDEAKNLGWLEQAESGPRAWMRFTPEGIEKLNALEAGNDVTK